MKKKEVVVLVGITVMKAVAEKRSKGFRWRDILMLISFYLFYPAFMWLKNNRNIFKR